MTRTYEDKRCPVCGVRWLTHPPSCSQHAHRPADAPRLGDYELEAGPGAGATLDAVAAAPGGLAYLAELAARPDTDKGDAEVIRCYLAERQVHVNGTAPPPPAAPADSRPRPRPRPVYRRKRPNGGGSPR